MKTGIGMIAMVAAALAVTAAAAARPRPLPPPLLVEEPLAPGSYAARAVRGASLASERCVGCHMVQVSPGTAAAPTFAWIAIQRSPDQLRAFLARPHGGTPPVTLSDDQIDDVIAYLQSFNPVR